MEDPPIDKVQQQQQQKQKSKTKKFVKYIRIFNIITALALVCLSIISSVFVIIGFAASLKLFLILSPLFMTVFALCLLAAEFKVKFVLKRVPLLKSVLGKGIFYLYLSSVIFCYLDIANMDYLAWPAAILLFISGLFYLFIHFGCSKSVKASDLEQNQPQHMKERLV